MNEDLDLLMQEMAVGQVDPAVSTTSVAVYVIFMLVFYLYVAFALMALAKKMGMDKPWLAFIPVANLYLMSKMAKMHWWPVVLVVLSPIPLLGQLLALVLLVYVIIWMWKIFEYFKKPGWWSILMVIPVANIVYYVLLGITAWGKTEGTEKSSVLEEEKEEEVTEENE